MSEEKSFLGKGFAFPLAVSETTGRFLESSLEADVKQGIYLILMTRKGERVMRPEFGCGIFDFAFETLDFSITSQMESSVKTALALYEPRIKDVEVRVTIDDIHQGKVLINIQYVVRSTNNPYNLVYPFFINEGIEL